MTKVHDGAVGHTESVVEAEFRREKSEVAVEQLGRTRPAAGKQLGAGAGAEGVDAVCEVIVTPKRADGSTYNVVDTRDGTSEHLGACDARGRSGGAELVSMESGSQHARCLLRGAEKGLARWRRVSDGQ